MARTDPQTDVRTRLAGLRAANGLTQKEMAWAVGIPIALYVRLERGQHRDPRLGWLVNSAMVLGLDPDDVLDPWMRDEWYRYDRLEPPEPEWRQRPEVLVRRKRYKAHEEQG